MNIWPVVGQTVLHTARDGKYQLASICRVHTPEVVDLMVKEEALSGPSTLHVYRGGSRSTSRHGQRCGWRSIEATS